MRAAFGGRAVFSRSKRAVVAPEPGRARFSAPCSASGLPAGPNEAGTRSVERSPQVPGATRLERQTRHCCTGRHERPAGAARARAPFSRSVREHPFAEHERSERTEPMQRQQFPSHDVFFSCPIRAGQGVSAGPSRLASCTGAALRRLGARNRTAWHRLASLLMVALVSVVQAAPPAAEKPSAPAQPADTPQYIRVTLSTWYEVDPKWPQRPPNVPWGQMPGVFVDQQDRVWLFTRADPPVQVYTADGRFVKAWGSGLIAQTDKGPISHFIKIDRRGHVWLADVGGHVILECTQDGRLLKRLGTPGEPGCDETHFFRPTDMAITPDGQVFVADGYGNARIVHFDAQGRFVKAWGRLGTKPGEFNLPHAIAIDSKGRLYVADRNNARIQVFDQDGHVLDVWRNLIIPWGLWVTQRDEIWVCGCSPMPWRDEDELLSCPPKDQILMKFDPSGRVLQLWTVPKGKDGQEKPGELNWVHGIAVDSHGNIYATDIMGQRAQKFVRHN